MKLSDMTAKLTCSIRNLNGKATRVLAATALAGAALATVPAAQAQHFSVGVQFGGPRYVEPLPPPPRFAGPVYGGPVYGGSAYGPRFEPGFDHGYDRSYWERRRYEEWRRREWFAHHGYDRFYGPR